MMGKLAHLNVMIFITAMVGSSCSPPKESSQLTAADLRERPVTGELGVPLGVVVEIRATIIADNTLHTKGYSDRFLLRVTEVSGKAVANPITMEFKVPSFAGVNLAENTFDLYKLKTGEKTESLDANQIANLEKDYVGKQARLVVYESGNFSGIPLRMPKDIPLWQDYGFGFSTYLTVLAER